MEQVLKRAEHPLVIKARYKIMETPPSPVITVKDLYQPLQGILRPRNMFTDACSDINVPLIN